MVLKIYDNLVESAEFVERDSMRVGSLYFNPTVNSTHVDNYIQTTTAVNSLSTNFTVEFWLYLVHGSRYISGTVYDGDHAGLVLNFGGQTSYIWYLYSGTYGNLRTTFNLTGSTANRDAPIPYNIKSEWHHIAITYDGTSLLYCLDGVLFRTFTAVGTLGTGTSNMRLGNITTYWLNGNMADFRIWNTTRTVDEISGNMNKRMNGNETGLIFYMPLNDGSGTTVKELVGGNNGSIVNATWADTNPPVPNIQLTDDYKIITSEFVESSTEASPFRAMKDRVQTCRMKEHYQSDVIQDGLVLWLEGEDFTNLPQTTKWRDRSGTGNHATVNNFAYTTASGSNGHGYLTFDGTSDYLTIPNDPSLNFTSATFEMRFKYKDRVGYKFIVCKRVTLGDGYTLMIESSTGEFLVDWGGSSTRWSSGYVIPLNSDITLTLVCTNGSRTLYVNGQYFSGTTADGSKYTTNTSNLLISKNTAADNDYIAMDLKHIRVYNRILSADEVLSNYNAGLKE